MSVRVHLYSDKTLVGKAIQWQTRSPFNHAAIEVNGALFEASAPLVKCAFGLIRSGRMIREAEMGGELKMTMFNWLIEQLNKPYDYTMVARFVTRKQETRETKGKWFCSELVAAAFQHIGIPLFTHTEPWEVSPGMLARTPRLETLVEDYD